MGFWAGIKHAINSTLGTKDFISLDKLIRNQYRLVPSDNIYEQFGSTTVTEVVNALPQTVDIYGKYKILIPGRVKIQIVYPGITNYWKTQWRVLKNNETVYEDTYKVHGSGGSDYKNSAIIECDFGDILSFQFTSEYTGAGTTHTGTIDELNFYGEIVNNFYEVVQ